MDTGKIGRLVSREAKGVSLIRQPEFLFQDLST